MEGWIDGFICVVGIGGMIVGVGMGFKLFDENVIIVLIDLYGVVFYEYYVYGELKVEGILVVEGIGQGWIIVNFEGVLIDMQFCILDVEGVEWVGCLFVEGGLCLGFLIGINVVGVVVLGCGFVVEGCKEVCIVMILCDSGFCYLLIFYNVEWLVVKGFFVFFWLM